MLRAARRIVEKKASTLAGVDDALDFVYGFDLPEARLRPWQIRSEIAQLLARLEHRRPATVLEIGTAQGGTLFLLTRVASDDAHLISVDLPGGRFGEGYPSFRARLYRAFARPRQRLDLIRADSHRPETVEQVRHILRGKPLDFLLIDGDHTLDGIRADFANYARLVADDGLIAIHDIVPGSPDVGDVPRFWRELKESRETEELVEDWSQGHCGIGLLRGSAAR